MKCLDMGNAGKDFDYALFFMCPDMSVLAEAVSGNNSTFAVG